MSCSPARRNGAGFLARCEQCCSRRPQFRAAPAASATDTPSRRAWRGAQHRGDRAIVQAGPRYLRRDCSCRSFSKLASDQGDSRPFQCRQARRGRRPCRRSAGSEPGAGSPGAPGCRGPPACGVPRRRPARGLRCAGRGSDARRAALFSATASRCAVDAHDAWRLHRQQFAVDACRECARAAAAPARRAAPGRRRCCISTCELRWLRKYSDSGSACCEPRFERLAAFVADQRVRIVAVGQEQEADLPAFAHLAQRILQRPPRGRAAGAIAVEAEDQLRCRSGTRATDAPASSPFPASRLRK